MGFTTEIQYCDSSLNLMLGCDGCELWGKNPDGFMKHCYAGVLHEKYAGGKGWPISFDQPAIFPERMDQAEAWSDLSYCDRTNTKFWLNKMPRVIFVNDMGDGFTRLLPDDWLVPFIPRMEASPHIYLMLTKRIQRMKEFWKCYGKVPDNIWLGTSVTSRETMTRVHHLDEIDAKVKWLSIEPMLERMDFTGVLVDWMVIGFESGEFCRDGNPKWMYPVREHCEDNNISFFVKQMGGTRNHHGNWLDLPENLRIRQMPDWTRLEWSGKTQPKPAQFSLL